MEEELKYKKAYLNRMRHVWLMLLVQVAFLVVIIVASIVNTWSGLYQDAQKTSLNASARYDDIMEGYKASFQSILIPIIDKIEEDPSFDEMQSWLQGKEEEFSQAVGEDVYDGIAFTYKGGYAHSWDYGDYSDYDPNTRPWYQQAQKADGEIALVAPYVTFTSEVNAEENADIVMSIAQKYNDEISFDLDLKLPKLKSILEEIKLLYKNEVIILYNSAGEILSTSAEELYAHNAYDSDDAVTESLGNVIEKDEKALDVLQIDFVGGKLHYLYFSNDAMGNTLCIMVPAFDIFMRKFFLTTLICGFLMIFVIYAFVKNRRNAFEFTERDRRLEVIENNIQKERLYVDVDHMIFFGNDMAKKNTENVTYEELYKLICSRIVKREDLPRVAAFLSPEVIRTCFDQLYVIKRERFLMTMQNQEGVMEEKTIEIGRLAFVQNRTHMVEIALLDATESVDLLKEALREAKKLKKEKEDEYNRFMSYICMAEDGVEELNIKDHTITRYYVEDRELQQQTISYPGMPFELFHEDDRARAHELYDEDKLLLLCQNEETSYSELRMKWYDAAEYRWCNVIVLGLPMTEKTPFNVLVLIKDTHEIKTKQIEQQKALEDAFRLAEEGSQAKGSFLSNMSHEIRTPLNAIIGYLTIASDKDSTESKKDYCIENCQIASKHLLQIINDILDMSSIENGKLKIAHEEFDLKSEISDITSIFYQNSKLKNVNFETHIENVTEEWVVGDQLRTNQVLMNLLSNAVKFTPEQGTVELKVEQLRKDDQRVYMKFTVRDTGIGMSEEYMSRIFHPFEQEYAGTAKKYGGSGLGLSITNNLVQMMGGHIDVASKQNEGTTFEVTMFFGIATSQHASNVQADYSHVRVLVVDDQSDECSYIKMMLKRCGAKADSVTSGTAALKKIRARKGSDYDYNLCIIDWNMPEMDGCEVTKKIRTELGGDMPIIIASAYDISEIEEEAKHSGANKVVAKPLFQSTLFDILVTMFGKYDPESEKQEKVQMDLSGLHVLLAEDNPMNMDIATTIMEKVGIKVDQAIDGKEAMEKFLASEAGTYQLILMDVQMPVMDGYEATEAIRESNHPEAQTIPIAAMTANAFAEDVAEALSRGMNAHIAKPINYDKLFEVLQKFSK